MEEDTEEEEEEVNEEKDETDEDEDEDEDEEEDHKDEDEDEDEDHKDEDEYEDEVVGAERRTPGMTEGRMEEKGSRRRAEQKARLISYKIFSGFAAPKEVGK